MKSKPRRAANAMCVFDGICPNPPYSAIAFVAIGDGVARVRCLSTLLAAGDVRFPSFVSHA